MYNHSGIITGTHLGHSYEHHIPTGQLHDNKKNSFNLPFSKDDIDIFKKRNKNYFREIEGYDHDIKKYKKIEHTHPTIMLSNLQNYNPTQGITYFEPHETDILLYHPNGEPRYDKEYVYDMSIVQKIDKLRKNDETIHKPEQYSFKLKPKYRT